MLRASNDLLDDGSELCHPFCVAPALKSAVSLASVAVIARAHALRNFSIDVKREPSLSLTSLPHTPTQPPRACVFLSLLPIKTDDSFREVRLLPHQCPVHIHNIRTVVMTIGVPVGGVAHGVPVHDDDIEIDIDDMRTASDFRGRRGSAAIVQQGVARMAQGMESRSSKIAMMFVSFAIGILVPGLALKVYYSSAILPDGAEKPCDRPVAGWLATYGYVGLLLGALSLYSDIKNFQLAPAAAAASAELQRQQQAGGGRVHDEEAVLRASLPVVQQAGALGCLWCCCTFPLGVFYFAWWVKGQFDVWGTYANPDISWDQSMETFRGCDPDLLGGARMVMLVSYLIGGIILTTSCCFCCLTLAVVGREVERMEYSQRAGGGGRRPGTHEMH